VGIIIDRQKKVIVQGITGREGSVRAKLMKEYGTQIVAGITPGRKGQVVHGIPVFDSVEEVVENFGSIDISVIFVPAPLVKNAAFEAIASGIKLVVLIPDRVPIYDTLEIAEFCQANGARYIGPNTLGLISPGEALLGMIGGRAQSARQWFVPGCVGVTSRSGGITSTISYHLSRIGIGQSTIIHIGGDAVVGLRHGDVVRMFEQDEQTKAVVMFGEIGTTQEEEVAELISAGEFTKPLIAFVGGAAAKEGTRFSHAGAIVDGKHGSHASKVDALMHAGAYVAHTFEEIFTKTKEVMQELGCL